MIGITLVFFIIGYYNISGYFQLNLFATDAPKKSTQVLSYNVRLFDLYNWSENTETRDKIFNFLEKENAGIMCFQEFYHQKNAQKFPTKDTLKTIFKNYHWHEKYTHEMHDKQFFGVVTLSQYPIINKGEVAFDNDPNNFCIYSDIAIQGDTIRIYNAHIGSVRLQQSDYEVFDSETKTDGGNEKQQAIITRLSSAFIKREEQGEAILRSVKGSPHPVLICGDFNDTPFSYVYRRFNNLLDDAFRTSGFGFGLSYIGKAPSFRIDYIFNSEDISTYEFQTHDVSLSDHRAISTYFKLP